MWNLFSRFGKSKTSPAPLKPVSERELKKLAFVLPWVKVPIGRNLVINCVPLEAEMRDRLIATIRVQRETIRELIKGNKGR